MARRSQTEKDDNRALKTIEVVNTLKESLHLYAEFVKATQKYTAMVNAATLSGRGVTELLSKIAEQAGGDIGAAIQAVAETQNAMLDRQLELMNTITDNLITSYIDKENGRLNIDKQDLLNFAKNYKAKRANSLKVLKKAESKAAAANKPKAKAKKPDQALAATQALEEATKKHDGMLTESMLEVVQLHRKKDCLFLSQWNTVMQADMVAKQTGIDQLDATTRDKVIPLLDKADDIPDEIINIAEGKGASLNSARLVGTMSGLDSLSDGSISNRGGGNDWDVTGPEEVNIPPLPARPEAQVESFAGIPTPLPMMMPVVTNPLNRTSGTYEAAAPPAPSMIGLPSTPNHAYLREEPVMQYGSNTVNVAAELEDLDNMINNFDFGMAATTPPSDFGALSLDASEIDELLSNL